MISVVIPSYKNPKYLDLCIQVLLRTQSEKNEILVVLDGYADLSRDVTDKYKNDISVLEFEENRGMGCAINYGFYNASNEYVLVAAEDNVFPYGWDMNLMKRADPFKIISCNQIEPEGPSMYNYKFHNYGKTVEEFQLESFLREEVNYREDSETDDGCTFPFFMHKQRFMTVGGFDVEYTSPFVVDWDFFLKLELIPNISFKKANDVNVYHFVSKSTKNRNGYIENPNEKANFFAGESSAAQYFEYKWGFKPQRGINNRCLPFLKF